ncbi:MAG: MurR/RpiR family transcriptional regulator [Ignavibacteriaceae bacterium]|nr:MurR/RpiR family transcriptional regulator [Ignavibacteriaceae bacterium]HRI45629.1 MurR/RpiR family transcriptional regulator [Ignavibacteriaceae bacterium]
MTARYKEIKEKIQQKFEKLPRNHRNIADYIVDNFDKIPFLSVHEIADKTGASVASIVRFAQRIGYSGYSDLREAIAFSLQSHLTKKDTFPLVRQSSKDEDILTSVANIDVMNINETLNELDRDLFNHAVKLMIQSNRVFTAGLGISYLLAEILAYQLTQVGIDASVLKHTYSVFEEQILYLKKNDVLVTFSFPPYSIETIDAAKAANKKGIKVISITNKPSSPVTFYSEAVLIVKSENMLFTNSFAAISVIINALATACAVKNKSNAKIILDESDKIMTNQKLVIK